MRRNSTSSIGALHPVLFCLVIYGISLFMAIFVCRTIYYTINEDSVAAANALQAEVYTATQTTALK